MRTASGPRSGRPTVFSRALGAALLLLIFTAIIFLPVTLPSCRDGASSSSQAVKKDKLLISRVKRDLFRETITLNGKILPINIVYLDALEGGRVDKIFVEVGAMVKPGDPILQMTNTNLLMDIMFRESELFQQSNNLRNTRLSMEQYKLQLNQQLSDIENRLQQQRRVYERYKELEKDSLISRHEYELAKDQYEYLVKQKDLTVESQKSELKFRQAQIEALEESLSRMQANLDIVKQRQENLTLVAPVSGQLTSLTVSIGESVSPGARLGQVDQWDLFKVRTSVDERYIAQVKMRDSGEFDFAGQTYEVDVRKIYPEVQDGKFEVDLEFVAEHPPGLKRGQSLQIRLDLVDSLESLLLTKGEFSRSSGNKWIYVLDETEKSAVKRRIRTGRETAQYFEVLEGLAEGEAVIVSSYESFKNRDRLTLR
ncbi:MAG: HlyD family efflux transporter periplasmic adaptor subunit [Candidatus Aminicenantes bacterium]|nr:HlyD family efflux transporter periplasmic adaptor subunit [Candidatus Aminicenantes bacterium]